MTSGKLCFSTSRCFHLAPNITPKTLSQSTQAIHKLRCIGLRARIPVFGLLGRSVCFRCPNGACHKVVEKSRKLPSSGTGSQAMPIDQGLFRFQVGPNHAPLIRFFGCKEERAILPVLQERRHKPYYISEINGRKDTL